LARKTVTFLVTSNSKGSTRRFSMPASWLKLFSVLGIVVFVLLAAATVDYVGLLLQSVETKRLRVQNNRLKGKFEVVEGQLTALEKSLERVKVQAQKLKMITNVEDEDRTLRLAIGPLPKPGQAIDSYNKPLADRQPASFLGGKDEPLFAGPEEINGRDELFREANRGYSSLSIRIERAVQESQLVEQKASSLYEALADRQSLMNATPSVKPSRGWFTSKFGYRVSPFTGRPVMHNGLDIASAPGAPVYAPADGVVSFAGYDAGYGKLVAIDHGYGVVTRYGHNSRIYVEVGQKVRRRDVVAAVGSTGRSTGPHLHYEVRVNGVPVDPQNYILDSYF